MIRTLAWWGGLCLFSMASPAHAVTVDLLIRGGTVYTGSAAPFVGDVAVAGDRIRAVGKDLAVRGA